MVRIGRSSHCGFVQEKTSARGGGAGTVHSAPHARGPQEREGTLEFKVAVSGTPYLSSYRRLRALHQEILEVFSLAAAETARTLSPICGRTSNSTVVPGRSMPVPRDATIPIVVPRTLLRFDIRIASQIISRFPRVLGPRIHTVCIKFTTYDSIQIRYFVLNTKILSS